MEYNIEINRLLNKQRVFSGDVPEQAQSDTLICFFLQRLVAAINKLLAQAIDSSSFFFMFVKYFDPEMY